MKRRLLACLAALVIVTAGCSSDDAKPAQSPTPTPSPSSNSTAKPASFTFGFGEVGKAKVGMTKADALATGYFDGNLTAADPDVCPAPKLAWKKTGAYTGLDVLVDDQGTIRALAAFSQSTIATAKGIKVGSSLADVKSAYGDSLVGPEPAGYGQTGVFIDEGNAWIGFLFDADPMTLDDSTPVVFMETTVGVRPELMRDGC